MYPAAKNTRVLQLALLFITTLFMVNSYAQDSLKHTVIAVPLSVNNTIDTIKIVDTVPRAYTIRNIFIEGNKKTKEKIILRELAFRQGDSLYIRDFPPKFEESKSRLKNLSLFHENEIYISVLQFEGNYVDVKVAVKERWYILPFPHLKPVDRNLSQWLFKEKANLSRVDYGIKLMWDNVTGNNDKLRFYFITGYTRQLQLAYRRPFIDKYLKWGLNFDISIGKNHEINYNTIEDKQKFLKLKDETFARTFFRTSAEATYRPAFYTVHSFGVGYTNLRVNDSVLKLNPSFFKNYNTRVSYPEFHYKLTYRNFDYNPYPTKGHAAEFSLLKQGFGDDVNLTQLSAKAIKYWPITKKAFYSIGAAGSIKVPFKQPYYTSQLLGYGDFTMRGYEYYVVDGVAGGLINATLAQQLANFKIHIPGTKWLTPRLIPLKIYGKVYGNIGYAHNPYRGQNTLNDKMLFGGGFGIDVVTMYDFNLKIDFSFNQLGQNGLYLQKKSTFQ